MRSPRRAPRRSPRRRTAPDARHLFVGLCHDRSTPHPVRCGVRGPLGRVEPQRVGDGAVGEEGIGLEGDADGNGELPPPLLRALERLLGHVTERGIEGRVENEADGADQVVERPAVRGAEVGRPPVGRLGGGAAGAGGKGMGAGADDDGDDDVAVAHAADRVLGGEVGGDEGSGGGRGRQGRAEQRGGRGGRVCPRPSRWASRAARAGRSFCVVPRRRGWRATASGVPSPHRSSCPRPPCPDWRGERQGRAGAGQGARLGLRLRGTHGGRSAGEERRRFGENVARRGRTAPTPSMRERGEGGGALRQRPKAVIVAEATTGSRRGARFSARLRFWGYPFAAGTH